MEPQHISGNLRAISQTISPQTLCLSLKRVQVFFVQVCFQLSEEPVSNGFTSPYVGNANSAAFLQAVINVAMVVVAATNLLFNVAAIGYVVV